MKRTNLTLRFFLELCALAALAYWGWHTGGSTVVQIGLAVAAPVVAAVVWGRFASPRSPSAPAAKLAAQALVLGAAVAALLSAGRVVLAVAFAVVTLLNAALMRVLGDDW